MPHRLVRVLYVAGALVALPALATGAEPKLAAVQTRGLKQSFILIKPDKPTAAVILFAGGHGALGLKSATEMNWGTGNFLVRSRDLFAKRNLMVAVIDAPPDHADRMTAEFRMSAQHAADIGAVAAYLKTQAPVPVWLVGTSMGTFSAARGAMAGKSGGGIDGLVLSSTITRAKPQWKIAQSHANGVASMALSQVTVPTLILSHKKDGCDITPAGDAPKLQRALSKATAVEVVLLEGGLPPQSDPCEAKSEHGFLGIEEKAVDAVAAFIATHGKR